MMNVFTQQGQQMVGSNGANTAKTGEEITPAQTRSKWFDSPLMFIGVVVALLVTLRLVERKVG